jgi:hypothetical protein
MDVDDDKIFVVSIVFSMTTFLNMIPVVDRASLSFWFNKKNKK